MKLGACSIEQSASVCAMIDIKLTIRPGQHLETSENAPRRPSAWLTPRAGLTRGEAAFPTGAAAGVQRLLPGAGWLSPGAALTLPRVWPRGRRARGGWVSCARGQRAFVPGEHHPSAGWPLPVTRSPYLRLPRACPTAPPAHGALGCRPASVRRRSAWAWLCAGPAAASRTSNARGAPGPSPG